MKVVNIGLPPRSEKKTKRVIDERYDGLIKRACRFGGAFFRHNAYFVPENVVKYAQQKKNDENKSLPISEILLYNGIKLS